MSLATLSRFLAVAAVMVVPMVASQSTYPPVCLIEKGPYAMPTGLPYRVDTDVGLIRGEQYGYNICNSTTQNQQSRCQTAYMNGLDDFCIWGPPEPGRPIGDIEGIMVAYCTKPNWGTRLIPAGALRSAQFMRTPDYLQIVGSMDQTAINIMEGDWGGEMDSGGADCRGNPMGALFGTNQWVANQLTQAIRWHVFQGGNRFCVKICDPARPNARHYCEHIYDRIGIDYNCPTRVTEGVFESCEGENQDYPGIYVENGVTRTYTQPPESLGAISTMPYVARVPSSSNCRTFSSAEIYNALPTPTGATTSAATTTTTGTGPGVTQNNAVTTRQTGSTGSSANTPPAPTGAALGLKSSSAGVLSAIIFAVIVAA